MKRKSTSRKQKKGFIRILETIIASIIILTALSFFFSPVQLQSQWDEAVFRARAQDALETAYKIGSLPNFVKSNDQASLRTFMESLFPKTADFSMRVRGIPNPVIFVGCACSAEQKADVETKLQPVDFTYKERSISIRVEIENVADIRPQTNILLFRDVSEFNTQFPANKDRIDRFLERGGTLMLFDDVAEEDITANVRAYFGLAWNSAPSGGRQGEFANSEDGNAQFRTIKYLEGTSDLDENTKFGNFHHRADINKINVDKKTLIVSDSREDFSFVKINEGVMTNGRAVWFADYDQPEGKKETDKLLKAVVMWASGESYKMDGLVVKTPPQKHQQAKIIIYDKDPYEFSLTFWSIF